MAEQIVFFPLCSCLKIKWTDPLGVSSPEKDDSAVLFAEIPKDTLDFIYTTKGF